MQFPAIVVFIYGLFILIGGIMGHIKAQSRASLIMGTAFAILTLLSSFAMFRGIELGRTCAMLISILLTAFFAYRFSLSFQFMPAGLMILLSALVFAVLFFTKGK